MRNENNLAQILVQICYDTHCEHGPGLLESFYEKVICFELKERCIPFERQKRIGAFHKGIDMGVAFVADLIIDNKLIIELKSIESLAEVHHKQILTYLKITGLRLGLLINFNVPLIKNGIHRKVNNL